MAELLANDRFPLSANYDPEWVLQGWMGPNVLWLTEWLCERMDLKPGMRVLDMGCGKALSSVSRYGPTTSGYPPPKTGSAFKKPDWKTRYSPSTPRRTLCPMLTDSLMLLSAWIPISISAPTIYTSGTYSNSSNLVGKSVSSSRDSHGTSTDPFPNT